MKNLIPVEMKNQRVLTTQQLAEVYETDVKNIQMNFKNNKNRFVENVHYYYLQGADLKAFKSSLPNDIGEALKFAPSLYLWTERGASRHCKILDTDRAWEQFDNLEDTYFKIKEQQATLPNFKTGIDVEYLNGFANLVKTITKVMKAQGSSANKIAQQTELLCTSYDIPLVNSFAEPAYEQTILTTTVTQTQMTLH